MPKISDSLFLSLIHYLEGKIVLSNLYLPKLSRKDFLLTDEEAYRVLEFRDTRFPEDILVKECRDLVGTLSLPTDALEREFYPSKNDVVDETSCLQYFLSDSFVQNLARCFGSAPIGNDFKRYNLKECFDKRDSALRLYKPTTKILIFRSRWLVFWLNLSVSLLHWQSDFISSGYSLKFAYCTILTPRTY